MEEFEGKNILPHKGKNYIPNDGQLWHDIVQKYHDHLTAGHPGELQTFNVVKEHYWWPGLQVFVKNYVQGCGTCQQFKIDSNPVKPAFMPLEGAKCQGFISRTPVWVRDGSLPKGLNEYPAQLPCLGQLRTCVGSKSLVMQDYKQLPWLIMAPEYFGNLRREMSRVATRTFNVLYYFPFIWFIGSHYPRSYI